MLGEFKKLDAEVIQNMSTQVILVHQFRNSSMSQRFFFHQKVNIVNPTIENLTLTINLAFR